MKKRDFSHLSQLKISEILEKLNQKYFENEDYPTFRVSINDEKDLDYYEHILQRNNFKYCIKNTTSLTGITYKFILVRNDSTTKSKKIIEDIKNIEEDFFDYRIKKEDFTKEISEFIRSNGYKIINSTNKESKVEITIFTFSEENNYINMSKKTFYRKNPSQEYSVVGKTKESVEIFKMMNY